MPRSAPGMTPRRLVAALFPGALLGVLVHIAAFGNEHLPGRAHAPELLAALAVAALLAGLGSFLGGALRQPALPIATRVPAAYGLIALATAGYGTFALIELSEGHFILGGCLRALVAALPLAALVRYFCRHVANAADRAGNALASFARTRGRVTVPAIAALFRRAEPGGGMLSFPGAVRDRAP